MREPLENSTPVEKVAILRRHLIDRVPVSGLCDGYQLSPTMFDLWQKQFFEDGTSASERKNGSPESQLRVSHLEVEEFLKGLDIGLVERLDSLTDPPSCSLGHCLRAGQGLDRAAANPCPREHDICLFQDPQTTYEIPSSFCNRLLIGMKIGRTLR